MYNLNDLTDAEVAAVLLEASRHIETGAESDALLLQRVATTLFVAATNTTSAMLFDLLLKAADMYPLLHLMFIFGMIMGQQGYTVDSVKKTS